MSRGVNSLGFVLNGCQEFTKADMEVLLKDICLECVEINFVAGCKKEVSWMHLRLLWKKEVLHLKNTGGNQCRSVDRSHPERKELLRQTFRKRKSKS